jgi:hypothetical protein
MPIHTPRSQRARSRLLLRPEIPVFEKVPMDDDHHECLTAPPSTWKLENIQCHRYNAWFEKSRDPMRPLTLAVFIRGLARARYIQMSAS